MKEGNKNRDQNKQFKKTYNKNNPNDKINGNNEQTTSYFRVNNKKYRNCQKNGKDDYNSFNNNFRKMKKKKREENQYIDNNFNLYQSPKSSNDDYYEQQRKKQKFQNNQEQINNINKVFTNEQMIKDENHKNNNQIINKSISPSQIQNQTVIPFSYINNNNNYNNIINDGNVNNIYEQYNPNININNYKNNNQDMNLSNDKNYSMYINPNLINLTNNFGKNISLQENNKTPVIKENCMMEGTKTYTNPNMNNINYQQNDLINNNIIQTGKYNSQQFYGNNLINIKNGITLGNTNRMNQFQNYNNFNQIGNLNYVNKIQNERNQIQNIAPQICEKNSNNIILNSNNTIPNYNYGQNNKLNINMNNNQIYQNKIIANNNAIIYSPFTDNQNMIPSNTISQNSNFNSNRLIKNNLLNNNIGLNDKISLSSQSNKNTIPNFNINSIDNLNLNGIYLKNIPNKFNSQGNLMISNNNNIIPNDLNVPRFSISSNFKNNYKMKNNQINFPNDINNNNKFYKFGGDKKEFIHELNNNIKKSHSNNIISDNCKNSIIMRKKNEQNNINDDKFKKLIFKLNIKSGQKIINIDIYENCWNEVFQKITSQLKLSENHLILVFLKIKQAFYISNEIFKYLIDFYTYKQILKIMEINEKMNNKNYMGHKNKSKSVSGKNLINNYKDNDTLPYLCDFKKYSILNNSF